MTSSDAKGAKRLCIDLCSGLGGFSRAFVDAGWEVITVDIEPKFKPTICADVTKLGGGDIEKVTELGSFKAYEDVRVIMSPPCTLFSRAAGIGFLRKGTAEMLMIVAHCARLVEEIRPRGFIMENPDNGYLRFFLGKPNSRVRLNAYGYITVKPTAFWGNIRLGMSPTDSPRRNKTKKAWANINSKNPAKRAEMPYGLSQAILEAVSE